MRKNGKNGRLISIKQYKFTDLFCFALILAVSELLIYFASHVWFAKVADYYVSFALAISLIVIMRWGWVGIFYSVASGILLCALSRAGWQAYLCYFIGNSCIATVLFITKFLGKDRVQKKWYFTLLYAFVGWVSINSGFCAMGAVFKINFLSLLTTTFGFGANGVLSFIACIIALLIMRRIDGMFEDQKSYLIRQDRERKERMRRDEFGDEHIEIDEEALSILKRWDEGLSDNDDNDKHDE